MKEIRSFKDLIAWQKAMDLVVAVYRLTRTFPPDERYGITAQARKSVVSIPSNIAEGYGRRSRADYVRFLDIAMGSANELETQLLASGRLAFAPERALTAVLDLTNEVQRILGGLVRGLERSATRSVKE